MRRYAAIGVVLVMLNGCGSARFTGHTGGHVSSGQGAYVSVGLGETASSVIIGGAMLGIYLAGQRYQGQSAPPMAEDRLINEQDCTQPIAQPTANLRCR